MHKIYEERYVNFAREKKTENDYNTHDLVKNQKRDNIIAINASAVKNENGKKSERIIKLAQMLEEKLYKTESNKAIDIDEFIPEKNYPENILHIMLDKPIVKKNKISKSSLKILF
jgi:hypothetical protein